MMLGDGVEMSGAEQVIDQLGDADPGVRLRAVLQVGEGRLEGAAAPLVDRFGLEPDFQIREALTWAALRIESCSLPLVLGSLHSARWLARLQAVHTLSKLGRFEDGPVLLPLIADPIDAVAARAYWAAARTHNPAVIPTLVGELARGDAAHRNSLTVALTAFGSLAVHAIVRALRTVPLTPARTQRTRWAGSAHRRRMVPNPRWPRQFATPTARCASPPSTHWGSWNCRKPGGPSTLRPALPSPACASSLNGSPSGALRGRDSSH